jgi:hypothetical protein
MQGPLNVTFDEATEREIGAAVRADRIQRLRPSLLVAEQRNAAIQKLPAQNDGISKFVRPGRTIPSVFQHWSRRSRNLKHCNLQRTIQL